METIEIEYEEEIISRETSKLFMIQNEEMWIPKSLIVSQDEDTIEIPVWKARDLGLTED